MDIRYAQDTSSWKEWQREYRFGAFFIFPPAGVIEYVDDLRRRYDPASHVSCQAHVSLSEPWPRALTDRDLAQLQDAPSRVAPFTITCENVHTTPPYPGVVYAIALTSTFRRLRSTIHSIPLLKGSLLRRQDIPPHMTIAEFITMEQSADLAAQLDGQAREASWECDQVEYAVPDDRMRLRRVMVVPLGTEAG
jgi:hypothetical protein